MASRASTSAVVILLVSLAIVFVLVANNGVSTGVYLPDQPTHTPAPTAGPSPTPLPDPAVENWQESAPGQLSYVPRPESNAQVFYSVTTLDEFAGGLNVEPPPADAPYPALTVLEAMRASFEEQIAELNLDAGPDAIDGPAIELVGGVPLSRLRVQLDAQEETAGGPFPGLDLVIGLIDRPGDEVQLIQYRLQETPDPAIYQDFRAWLEAKAAELSGAEATETPSDDEPTDDEATEEDADEPAEDAESAAPEAPADEAAAGAWNELMPGVLIYAEDPTIAAQIAYRSLPVAEFVEGSGFEMPADDAEAPGIDLLTQLRDTLAEQLTGQGVTLADDAFTGPEAIEVAGKPAARLRLVAPPEQLEGVQPFPGLDIAIILVELPDDQLAAIQYTYQGVPEASVYVEFETWLAENAERATEPIAVEETPAEETTGEEATEEATEPPASD